MKPFVILSAALICLPLQAGDNIDSIEGLGGTGLRDRGEEGIGGTGRSLERPELPERPELMQRPDFDDFSVETGQDSVNTDSGADLQIPEQPDGNPAN